MGARGVRAGPAAGVGVLAERPPRLGGELAAVRDRRVDEEVADPDRSGDETKHFYLAPIEAEPPWFGGVAVFSRRVSLYACQAA